MMSPKHAKEEIILAADKVVSGKMSGLAGIRRIYARLVYIHFSDKPEAEGIKALVNLAENLPTETDLICANEREHSNASKQISEFEKTYNEMICKQCLIVSEWIKRSLM